MTVNLSPIGGAAAQFFNNNGVILAGGSISTYIAGTNTPQPTYTTSAGNIAHTNPIILDSTGRVPTGEIWLVEGVVYKFVIKDASNVLIGTYDNISGINDFSSLNPIIFNSTGTGSQTVYSLLIAPKSKNYTNVYINGVYQFKNTYTISGITLTFSEAPPVTSLIEVEY